MAVRKMMRVASALVLPMLLAADAPTTRPVVFRAKDQNALRLALVTNNASDYWTYAKAGVAKYEKEADVKIDFKILARGTVEDQVTIIKDLADAAYDGIGVSAFAPDSEVDLLKEVASATNLVCFDSICPKANAPVSIYVDNVAAGRTMGKRLVELLPDGGKVAVMCGYFKSQNGGDRLAGIKEAVKDHKIDIIELEDNTNREKTASLTTDTLAANADLKAFVGVWSYEGPGIVDALDLAGKTGTVTVLAFDQEKATLKAVADGKIESTFVADPFEMGYQTAKWLHQMAVQGDAIKLPADGKVVLEMRRIDKTNVEAYRKDLDDQKNSVK